MTVHQTATEHRTTEHRTSEYRTSRRRRLWLGAGTGLLATAAALAVLLGGPGVAHATGGLALQQAAVDSVKIFQFNLKGLSYYTGTIDGKAGPLTTTAAAAFQKDNCIKNSGELGPLTTTALRGKVREVQKKAGVTTDGIYGPVTTGAVSRWQKNNGLQGLGMAGPKTMAKMGITRTQRCGGTPTPATIRTKIASTARSQVGVGEPTGCKKYGPCQIAWCAMFAEWSWRTAGVKPVPTTYVARGVGLWGKQRGLFDGKPEVGDIAVYGPPANVTGGHVAIVVAVHANGNIDTVDGNWSNKVTLRTNVNPRTATGGANGWRISGYVDPPGA